MNIKQEIRIHNKFRAVVQDANTKEVVQEAEAYNIVLNNFWNGYLYPVNSGIDIGGAIALGKGVGELNPERTTMFDFVCLYATTEESTSIENNVVSRTTKMTLSESQHNGITFTEIGLNLKVGNYPPNISYLATHALFTDLNGNPITIVKDDTKIITFYATLYCVIPEIGNVKDDVLYVFDNQSLLNICKYGVAIQYIYLTSSKFKEIGTALSYSGFVKNIQQKQIVSDYQRYPLDTVYGNLGCWDELSCVGYGTIKNQHINTISNDILGVGDGSSISFQTKFDVDKNLKIFFDGVETNDYTLIDKPRIISPYGPRIFSSGILKQDGTFISTGSYVINSVDNTYAFFLRSIDSLIYDNPTNSIIKTLIPGPGSQRTYFEGSHDGVNWILLGTLNSTTQIQVPIEHQVPFTYYRYSTQTTPNPGVAGLNVALTTDIYDDTNNIVFNTPPAENVQITASYDTICILKDENHVLDVTATIQYGEYTEGL